MRAWKKVSAITLSTIMAIGMMSGCGNKPTTSDPTTTSGNNTSSKANTGDNEEIVVEIVAKGFQHDFWQAVLKGTEQAAAEFNVKTNFVGPKSYSDIA